MEDVMKTYEIDELWQSRGLRDERARTLRQQGHEVRRSSVRGVELHPDYVEDARETVSADQRGFGNVLYRTRWAVLYRVEANRPAVAEEDAFEFAEAETEPDPSEFPRPEEVYDLL